MKFLHLNYKITPGIKDCLEEIPRRGGMYNWLFLFKGDIRMYHEALDELENYDVVQLNISGVDMNIIPQIAKKLENSSTTFVINNDYVAEAWHKFGFHPLMYENIQKQADMVFGTEPYQTSCMIDGAFCIPHPHWIKQYKKLSIDDADKDPNSVGTAFHSWEGLQYYPALALLKIKEKRKILTRLYNYHPDKDNTGRWTRALFDEILPQMPYPEYIDNIQQNQIFWEPCSYHTYGRNSVDTAALGLATVGSDRVFSMRKCWPNLCCDPYNLKQTERNIIRLLNDEKFKQEQLDLAFEKCEYFNYKNSKKRFTAALEMTREGRSKMLEDGYWVWKDDEFVPSYEIKDIMRDI